MKYFLPDSQDLVDPSFDFERERRSATRLRQRDDLYAHEVFAERVLDGILVSKGIVDGSESAGGRYTLAQRHRLLRVGAREFFRIDRKSDVPIATMGDCGAFTYVKDQVPPYTVDEVIQFYVDCGFDYGISVDHVILAYSAEWDEPGAEVPAELRERQEITLELASEFFRRWKDERLPFEPLGVAQGWSPRSYARATQQLQKIGYRYIAVGGMVPLKTPEILAALGAIDSVRGKDTRLHLLGVTRTEQVQVFAQMGVKSFDSTSPLRQAFKDDKDNYHTMDRTYVAVRIPQVEGNPKLQKRISSGKVSQGKARELERTCLDGMRRFDAGELEVGVVLDSLQRYDELCGNLSDYRETYREVLTDRPWKQCSCDVCRKLGHHVILFRGAERNRRRGFHNTWVFYRRLARQLGGGTDQIAERTSPPPHARRTSAPEVFS
ncbi:tRNA-guanine transglycosylase DpdA [Sorangium cellulosum]|uniref:tRNA-guanine transglycosylase DpdA n=1 Tax=Sorangium cellulosum TaxID=56 RepID=UPI0007C78187|nr:tRNA-guanine transglycosylase DpdA [Sorangium cellulosum]